MAYLTALNGSAMGRRYNLDKPSQVLGRHPECEIVLDVGAVSRQHAKITQRDDDFTLHDLQSRNGTYLNGRLISQPTILQDGDLLRICDLEFSMHLNDEAPVLSPLVPAMEGSSFGILMVDDPSDSTSRAVTSKVEVRGSQYGTQLTTSAEARLTALLEISTSLGKAVALEEVLPKVLDSLFKIFLQADRAFIVLADSSGAVVPRWWKTRRDDQQDSLRISRTVMREVMERKEAIISLDAANDQRFELSQSIADFRIRSMIVAPLLDSDDNAIGAIQMDTLDQRNRFEEKDLEILLAVALQAGIAIQNAQLHEQMVEKELVEQDLKLARQVQQAFLPAKPLDIPGFRFFHYYLPANHIGGDYFDYIHLNDGRVAVIVADVVGHGVAAAMFMAKLSAEARFALASEPDLASAISKLNDRLSELMVERFVTLVAVVIHPQTGSVTVVNAGHMAPIWTNTKGTVKQPSEEEAGLPVGIVSEQVYESVEFKMGDGDVVVLYTDGINEASDPQGKLFSIEKIIELVQSGASSVEDIGKRIVDSVNKHVANGPQQDDMCLVVFSRTSALRGTQLHSPKA